MNDETLNLTEYQAALKKAGMPWAVDETITLTCRESLKLLELTETPPLRNEKFTKAMAGYEKQVVSVSEEDQVVTLDWPPEGACLK